MCGATDASRRAVVGRKSSISEFSRNSINTRQTLKFPILGDPMLETEGMEYQNIFFSCGSIDTYEFNQEASNHADLIISIV